MSIKNQKPHISAARFMLLTIILFFALCHSSLNFAQNGSDYEYFVPLRLPNQVFPSSDWGRYLEFTGLYDSTSIELDIEHDGIADASFSLDRGSFIATGYNNYGPYGPTDFQQGTHIKSDKPVLIRYAHRNNDYGSYDDYISSYVLLPTSMWGKEFYAPMTGIGINVVSCTDVTTIYVDINHDGISDITTTINAGEVAELGPISDNSYITADKKVFVTAFHYDDSNKDDFWTYEVLPVYMQGKKYYIPESGTSLTNAVIAAMMDSTQVNIDTDKDGVYDITQIMQKGEHMTISNFLSGACIVGDKKIHVVYKNDRYLQDPWLAVYRHYAWAYSLLPADYPRKHLFNDYLIGHVTYQPNHISLVSLSDGNHIYVDLDDDGVVDSTNTMNSGESWEFDCSAPTNIFGSYPFTLSSADNVGEVQQAILDGHLHYPIHMNFFDAPCPVPNVKANGLDGPISISRAENLTVNVEMSAWTFRGMETDWWLLVKTPFGWYHYDRSAGWIPSKAVTHQGALLDLSYIEVLNQSGLPSGIYRFYFGVDLDKNGIIDLDQAYYDMVEVTINP